MGEVAGSSEDTEMEVVAERGTEEEEEEERKEKDGSGKSSELVSWGKSLPRMVLRVLLVEADDSTRQIIAALLRKCSYRVAAVPDGLMAWETLKRRPHNIDLILTEVELPSISGYALLTLVMEHDICKNIPVIMMSSQDSISMVLKCMLKGAADFLIKPVRRNELKNLWQHVWRRQALTAGHVPENSPIAEDKVEATSENKAASDHSSDCATSLQKSKECSEKASDAQSCCTTPYLVAESPLMQNIQGCSQPKFRIASNLGNTERKKYGDSVKLDRKSVLPENNAGGFSVERSNRLGMHVSSCNETYHPTALRWGAKEHARVNTVVQDRNTASENERRNACILHGNREEMVEPSTRVIDLIGTFDNGPKSTDCHCYLNEGVNKFEFTPELELSLRRSSSSKNEGVDERPALNHSNASAFSWYNGKTLRPFFPISTSNCLDEFKEDVIKSAELSSNQPSQNSNVSQPSQMANGDSQYGAIMSSNQEVVKTLVISQSGQPELACANQQLGMIPVTGLGLNNISTGYGHILPPLYFSRSGLPPGWSPKLASQREQSPFPSMASVHSNAEIHDYEQNCGQSDETMNNSLDQNVHRQNTTEPTEEPRHGSPAAGQSTSSSLCNGVANYNNRGMQESFSSRNDGNVTSAVGVDQKALGPESLNDGGLLSQDGLRGIVSHRSSHREAALTKFRMKRKDRCYEKKVRYQSRKRLAEQRPRVKGQFVRQVQNEGPMADNG